MLFRVLAGSGSILLASAIGFATEPPSVSDQPTELPPLLTPPTDTAPPQPQPYGGAGGEYDHGHLYLPHYVPPDSHPPETCRPLGRWWVNPSVELAWVPSRPLPNALRPRVPAGTSRIPRGPVLPTAGQQADTFRAGFGLSVGRFLGDSHTHAIEGNFFLLGNGDETITGYAPGLIVAFPGGAARSAPTFVVLPTSQAAVVVGTIPATLSTWFTGGDANYRCNLLCGETCRLDALAGYRFAYLQDELYLGEAPDPGRDEYRQNRLAVSNAFHGGQVGLVGEVRAERWYVSGTAKLAMGTVTADVTTTGTMIETQGWTPSGFMPLTSLTSATQAQFAVLPTVNVLAGRQFGEHARVFAGYSFRYLSRVTRLADVVNPATTSLVASSDFWVQAMNFGVELRY